MAGNVDFSLVGLRKALELSQAKMAGRMGLSLRPYQELEAGDRRVRARHIRLAESVALDIAIEQHPALANDRRCSGAEAEFLKRKRQGMTPGFMAFEVVADQAERREIDVDVARVTRRRGGSGATAAVQNLFDLVDL